MKHSLSSHYSRDDSYERDEYALDEDEEEDENAEMNYHYEDLEEQGTSVTSSSRPTAAKVRKVSNCRDYLVYI